MGRRRGPRGLARLRAAARASLAFLFSNVGVVVLVAGYTIAGAFMFQAIEGASEMERVSLMARERDSTVQYLWHNVTLVINPLNETLIKDRVGAVVLGYQRVVVVAARRGWDGPRSSRQWSFSNAFLYSMTVITTIGYGHLSPRTSWGKVATIVYALLGMPLFLLYLSNVGSLLARWFKCVYSLCCLCRGCPGFRPRRVLAVKHQLEISEPESIERRVKWRRHSDSEVSQQSQLNGYRKHFKPHPKSRTRYSPDGDIPYRIRSEKYMNHSILLDTRHCNMECRAKFRHKVPDFKYDNHKTRLYNDSYSYPPDFRDTRQRSLVQKDVRRRPLNYDEFYLEQFKSPFWRKPKTREAEWYEMDRRYRQSGNNGWRNMPHPYTGFHRKPDYRSASAPHWRSDGWSRPSKGPLDPWGPRDPYPVGPSGRRGWSLPAQPCSVSTSSEFSYVSFDPQSITVPISVCVLIMVGYLVFGSMIFGLWEQWDLLDGAYFCFISLTSIGFGDFVPGERVYTPRIETSFVVCSLYLMLGMALVAMCFNLMQEQVIHYFAGLKRALKRICRCQCQKRHRVV